jgi:hypothetical protein
MSKIVLYIVIFLVLIIAGGYIYTRYQETMTERSRYESNREIDSLKNANLKLQYENELDRKDFELAMARDSLYNKELGKIQPVYEKKISSYKNATPEEKSKIVIERVNRRLAEMRPHRDGGAQ